MKINWYPGHMLKTKKMIKEKINLIDVVYEVLDARIPYSSKLEDIDDYLLSKPRLLILTKSDLCDLKETNKWIKYYEEKGYKVVLVDLLRQVNLDKIFFKTKELMKPFNEKRLQKGLQVKSTRVLVIGIPNVGKSTLINQLVGKKVVKVGNKPGLTKSLTWIRLKENIELLDSPGILWPKLKEKTEALNLGVTLSIKKEILPLENICQYLLIFLNKYYYNALKEYYNIDQVNKENILEVFKQIGKQKGLLIKGGEVDYNQVFIIILKDFNEGLYD